MASAPPRVDARLGFGAPRVGLAYLQLASLKRTSPGTLAHVIVPTYDRATRAAAALGDGRDKGVDCFLDEAFLETWGEALADASASTAEKNSVRRNSLALAPR